MPEKNPIDKLLTQVADLINKIQNYDKPIGEISQEVLDQLDVLEKGMVIFEELNQQTFEEAHVNLNLLRQDVAQNAGAKEKKLLERAKIIEKDAQALQLSLSMAIERVQKSAGEKEREEKRLLKERQKKFKRLGDRGWIPM